MKILLLSRYGDLAASSRLRFSQYSRYVSTISTIVVSSPFFSNRSLSRLYKHHRYGYLTLLQCYIRRIFILLLSCKYDLVWIEKEALPWLPVSFELFLLRSVPYVLDYDDAVFHDYDSHRFSLVRWALGRRLDRLMAKSALVVAGNNYLAQRAHSAGAKWVEVLPTVIDLERYPVPCARRDSCAGVALLKIVWIGSPSTARYLEILRRPLQELAQRLPFILRIIGAKVEVPGVQSEMVPWSESTEVAAITECDVGVMPLYDSAWERGKCGYKLIQYMACGLPVVASPVGVNCSIVRQGENGYLANNEEEWVVALESLLRQADLRDRMGAEGRLRVENEYCLQVTGPKLAKWLRQASKRV